MSEVKLTRRIFKQKLFWWAIGKQNSRNIICGSFHTKNECKKYISEYSDFKTVKPLYLISFNTRFIERVRLDIQTNPKWVKLRKILGIKEN